MRCRWTCALVLIAIGPIASRAAIGAREEPGVVLPRDSDSMMTTTIAGTLVSRNGDSFVVEKDTGARLTFALGGGAVIPEAIEPGDRVAVTFDTLDGREYHAVGVRAEGGADAAPGEAVAPGASGTPPEEAGSMPETASPLPILVLIGLITTGAAAGLRAFRRRAV